MARKKNPFALACTLWVYPDFSPVERGEIEPPWVNHDDVDFEPLRAELSELLSYGDGAHVRIANDTIDQVTLQTREMLEPDTIRCADFCETLLTESHSQHGDIIDVRKAWSGFHYLDDRTNAPPPIIIPFVAEGADFESVMLTVHQARLLLRIPSARNVWELGRPTNPDDDLGQLPKALRDTLSKQFGITYQEHVMLDAPAMHPRPHWLKSS